MKRLYWSEIIMMIASFTLVLNGHTLFGIVGLLLETVLIGLFIKKIQIMRFIWIAVFTYLITYLLARGGGLTLAYDHLEFFLLALGFAIAAFYELVDDQKYLKVMIRPYFFTLIALIIFTVLAFISRDNESIINAYPLGIFSLLSLIDIIFMPYLLCLTLSFIRLEYNRKV